MKHRRTYASLDKNIQCQLHRQRRDHGLDARQARRPSTSTSPSAIPDTDNPNDKITKIDIVKDGGAVVQTYTPQRPAHSVTWKPTITMPTSKYFFVRVWNAGGGDAPGPTRPSPWRGWRRCGPGDSSPASGEGMMPSTRRATLRPMGSSALCLTTAMLLTAGPLSPQRVPLAPRPGATILVDMRVTLQQASTKDQAFAVFGVVDHTPYRAARNTCGWGFTTNADGHGLHALRADWEASNSTDQGIRVIDYLPAPKPWELYIQWKNRVGKYSTDPDGNGTDDSYAVYPRSGACKRALFSQVDGTRLDYTLHRSPPEVPKLENGPANYARYGDPKVWNFNSEVGTAPFTTTVYLKAASAPGRTDGVYRLWINDTLVMEQHDVPADSSAFDRWEFPATSTVVPQAQCEYFWDIVVWRP